MKADDLPINTPCDEDWSAMRGGSQRRHCEVCARDVHDLSKMTKAEALAILGAATERVCVRYAIRPDGQIDFLAAAPAAAPAPAPTLVQLRPRSSAPPTRSRPAAIARAGVAAALLAACTPHNHDAEREGSLVDVFEEQHVVQGGIGPIEEPPPPEVIEAPVERFVPPPPVIEAPPPVIEAPPVVMGQAPVVKMGDVSAPIVEEPPPPPPRPEPRVEKMGKVAYDPGLAGDEDVPCDTPTPAGGPDRF